LGPTVDLSGGDDKLEALGLGVPPLPLWAHGEPAAMPALLFFSGTVEAPGPEPASLSGLRDAVLSQLPRARARANPGRARARKRRSDLPGARRAAESRQFTAGSALDAQAQPHRAIRASANEFLTGREGKRTS
jgi:hypothetical protein